MNILNLKLKDLFHNYLIKVFSIISSSRLILIFLISLLNKFSQINVFFAYKLEAEIGNLFKILLHP